MSEQRLNESIELVTELAENEGTSHYGNACTNVLAALAEAQREIARLTAIVDAIDLAGSGAQVSEFMESFPSVRRVVDLRAECDMASRETARLLTVNSESNAVCSCGCELVDHEERGEDGWSCDNESHECVPTSAAVAQMLRQRESALAAQRQSIAALREWSIRTQKSVDKYRYKGVKDYQSGVSDAHATFQVKLDALGLLPAATAGEK